MSDMPPPGPGHSRRSFLRLGATLGATALLPVRRAGAQALSVRPDIASTAGSGMLDLYAKAVAKMQDPAINIPPQPYSWTFQAHIHGVPKDPFHPVESDGIYNGSAQLRQRIDLIYGNPAAGTPRAAWKAAALKTWATCPHGSPWFVAWHRWYIFYFEKIIRQMSGAPNFALPYWNYASNDSSSLQLPAPFQDSANPLYEDLRGLGFASGAGTGPQNVPMNNGGFLPFSQTDYNPALSATPLFPSDDDFFEPPDPRYYAFGLTGRLEIQPHDFVHVNIGGLMQNVPVAAIDPIFYVHHCQIDRLWAAWQAAPGSVYNWGNTATAPSQKIWGGRQFTFVGEGGKLVTVTAEGELSTKKMGYEYSSLPTATPPPVMAAAPPRPQAMAAAAPAQGGGLVVGSGGARATVKRGAAPPPGAAAAPQVTAAVPTTLVLKDVKLINRPPAPLHVFVNLPEGAAATLDSPYHVGTLNLFKWDTGSGGPVKDLPQTFGMGHTMPGTGDFTFRIGEVLERQKANNLWDGGDVSVTVTTLGADRSRGRTYVRIGQIVLM